VGTNNLDTDEAYSYENAASPSVQAAPQSNLNTDEAYSYENAASPLNKLPIIPETPQPQGLISKYISPTLKTIDSYTGAPVRAAMNAYQQTANTNSNGLLRAGPFVLPINQGALNNAIEAYGKNFGGNTDQIPTGKDIAANMGASRTSLSDVIPGAFTNEPGFTLKAKKGGLLDVSPAGVAGLGINVATDPINYVPVGELANAGVQSIGNIAGKVSSSLTGIPEHILQTYSENLPEISQNIAKYGENTAQAADDAKSQINSALQQARSNANNVIQARLGTSGPEDVVDGSKVLNQLQSEKALLDPDIDTDSIGSVDQMIDITKKKMNTDGMIPLQDAYNLKRKVYGSMASGSYLKNGQIFPIANDAQRIAKGAAAQMVSAIEPVAPELTLADGIHSELHQLEDTMNSNILKEGKSDAALVSAGSSPASPNRAILDRMSNLTGQDLTGIADKYAAQKVFTNTPLLPIDTTGKSATRMLYAAGAGAAASHLNPLVAGLGAAAASPIVTKKAIQAAGLLGQLGINPARAANTTRALVNLQRQGLLNE
jgi:hypothetical protein